MLLLILFNCVRFHSSLSLVAGGKHDVLPPVGLANQGLPAAGAMPFGHGDVSFMQRQQARER